MQRPTLIAALFAGTMAMTAVSQGVLAAGNFHDGRTSVEVYVQPNIKTGGNGIIRYRGVTPPPRYVRNHRRDEPGVRYGEPYPPRKYAKKHHHDGGYRVYRPGFRFVLPRLGRFRQARFYDPYYGWYGARYRFPRVPARRIVRGLERRDFWVWKVRFKPGRNVYVVKARDPYGARVRIVIDPYTTEVLRYRPIG